MINLKKMVTTIYVSLTMSIIPLGQKAIAGVDANVQSQAASVRPAQIGQAWVYQVRNLYNNLIEDEITEVVTAITPNITIERTSKKYGVLKPEIQSSIGMVISDPYWNPSVHFHDPKPMWLLQSDNNQDFRSLYGVDDGSGYYEWASQFSRIGNETVVVNGKSYSSMKSVETIQFISSDFSQKGNTRVNLIWLDPAIGRWVMREINGAYYDANSGRGGDRYESHLRYELIFWK